MAHEFRILDLNELRVCQLVSVLLEEHHRKLVLVAYRASTHMVARAFHECPLLGRFDIKVSIQVNSLVKDELRLIDLARHDKVVETTAFNAANAIHGH